jgi:hypothetical protein
MASATTLENVQLRFDTKAFEKQDSNEMSICQVQTSKICMFEFWVSGKSYFVAEIPPSVFILRSHHLHARPHPPSPKLGSHFV